MARHPGLAAMWQSAVASPPSLRAAFQGASPRRPPPRSLLRDNHRQISPRHFSSSSNFALPIPPAARKQRSLPAAYWRGGTSRAVIFNAANLPPEREQWAPIFRRVIGSPDAKYGRQLDGLGGGISSLSKVCVVGRCADDDPDDADVDYTFAAIGVRNDEVDFSSNCGNMTSAIGPYAVDEGLVHPEKRNSMDGQATVRIRNTNTGKIIEQTFPVDENGAPQAYGDFIIDGVMGSAAKIRLKLLNPSGSKTGALLPTSSPIDTIDGIPATCIDVGNPCVFIPASSLAVKGTISPDEIESSPDLLAKLESLRCEAAIRMGMASSVDNVPGSIPKIAIVSEGHPGKCDITIRAMSVGQPHRAVPVTVALALASATKVDGSVPFQICKRSVDPAGGPIDKDGVTLGHAAGNILVTAQMVDGKDGKKTISHATIFRTARLLMKGHVFWKE